ncbi:MAG: DivIVA domain-containing protein [Clostridia bacterium]|nr:DivIVA domain-containing protein [Clostridia bacterium]
MLSAADIRNVKFGKSMNGYKQDEVEILLDKVEADYVEFEKIIRDFQAKIETLNKEISEFKSAQDSIQNVLLSAQRLADRIVGEAKEKSDEIIKNAESNIAVITAREKELSSTFELKAQERKSMLEKELAQMVENAEAKAKAITAVAEETVNNQQILFDKLKIEIAGFKSTVTAKYKEHLEILSTIPDTVPSDPIRLAEVLSASIDKDPEILNMFKKVDISSTADTSEVLEEQGISTGFKVEDAISDLDETEE